MRIWKKLMVTAIITFLSVSTVHADVFSVALSGVVVSKLINQFEDTATRLLGEGQMAGNAVVAKAGDELRIATANVAIAFSEQREKTFDQLSVQEQQVFIELNRIVESANALQNTVSNSLELAALDLQEMLNRIPLISKQDFFVRSVNGIALPHAAQKKIIIRGLGFGFDSSKRKYEVDVFVSGAELPTTSLTRKDAYTLEVSIPDNILESFYKQNELSRVPFKLVSKVSKPRFLLPGWSTEEYELSFDLLLFPIKAGNMQITQMIKTDATPSGPIMSTSINGKSVAAKPDRPFDWNDKKCVQNNQKIIGVRYECLNGQCGWCYSLRGKERRAAMDALKPQCLKEAKEAIAKLPPMFRNINPDPIAEACAANKTKGMEYLPDFDIEDNGVCVHAYRHCDGEQTTNFAYYIDYQELKTSFVPITSRTIDLEYGKETIFDLDQKNEDCSFIVSGQIPTTKQAFNYDHNTARSGNPLKLKGVAKVGDKCRATFELLQ